MGLWVSRDALVRGLPEGRVLGLSTTLIGASSLFFHATFTFLGMWLDLAGMYLFVTFLALSAFGFGPRLAPALAGVNAGLGVLTWFLPGARRWVFAALAAAAAAAQLRARPADRRFLWAALGLLGAGFALWSADYWGVACAPDSLFQGHAAWHLFGAAAAGAVYLHLRGPSCGPLQGEPSQQHEP